MKNLGVYLLRRIDYTPTCWLWTGAKYRSGYGHIRLGGKDYSTHRLAWELIHGPIDQGLCVCHTCDVRHCINPDHLFLGTKKDNSIDMARKGRGYNPSGMESHTCKLTDDQIASIRDARRKGATYQSIATMYNISTGYVGKIVRGEYRASS